MKKVLFISNGYAEDLGAIAIIKELKQIHKDVEILALPIVGNAKHFKGLGVKIIGPHWELPGQGVTVGLIPMLKDLACGALFLYLGQLISLYRHRNVDLVVGVGDYTSVLISSFCPRKPFMFVWACPSPRFSKRTEKYMREQGVKMFMLHPRFKHLDYLDVPQEYVGNVLLDTYEIKPGSVALDRTKQTIGILPGSRKFAYKELPMLIKIMDLITQRQPVNILFSVAKRLNKDKLMRDFKPSAKVVFCENFGDVICNSDLIIGLGGQGNEIAASLGKPIITYPSNTHPRRVKKMVRWHSKSVLKGACLQLNPDPENIARKVVERLNDKERMRLMSEKGKELMGERGASKKIAKRIKEYLLK
ncbi:hypothetical protein ACFLZ2_01190 [Candidatus Margulisiibacteriota bacterium]